MRWVIETLRVDFGEAAFSLHLRQPAPAANPIALLQGQIAREQSRLERVRNAYEAGIDTLEEYRQNKEKLSATLEQLRRQLALLQAQESPQPQASRLPLYSLLSLEKEKASAFKIHAGFCIVRCCDWVLPIVR